MDRNEPDFRFCESIVDDSLLHQHQGLTLPQARASIKQVATVTAGWRDIARAANARAAEITRMASAFD